MAQESVKSENKGRRDRWIFWASAIVAAAFVIYLLAKIFGGNPLIATWQEEDKAYTIAFEKDGTALVTMADELSDGNVISVRYAYEQDKDGHTVTIMLPQSAIDELAEDTGRSTEDAEFKQQIVDLQGICSDYDYTVKGNQLILTNREMGTETTLKKS
jgi:hypothetical protein